MLIAVGLECEVIVDSSKPRLPPTAVFLLRNFERENLQLA